MALVHLGRLDSTYVVRRQLIINVENCVAIGLPHLYLALPMDDDSLNLSAREGYDRWSDFYDQDDIPLHLLEESVVGPALGDVRGLEIIDLGCGTGRQTVRLSKMGAKITGLDQSEGMLEKAERKNQGGNIRFLHGDLNKLLPFPDDSFDRVVSFLVLEHISDLTRFFSECRRICRNNGWLYFTAMHPAMTLKGVQARYTEDSGRKVYPKSWPYQICDYVNAAIEGGLVLQQLSEHTPEDSHAEVSERAQKYKGWPLLLTMKYLPNPNLKIEV